MIAGVISFEPSQATPPNGFANVCAPIAALYSPGSTPSNAKVPSSAVVVVPTLLPAASISSTVTPGSPSSSCSTLPGVPPPGLKSRQTTPVIPPWALRVDRLLRARRHRLGRDRGQAEQRNAARMQRRLQHEPGLRRARQQSLDGEARSRARRAG